MRDAGKPDALEISSSDLETFVVCQNIKRYLRLIAEAMNADERSTLEKLLAEERMKLQTRRPVEISGTDN